MSDLPARIWLTYEIANVHWLAFEEAPTDPHDNARDEYVRADLADAWAKERDRLRADLAQLEQESDAEIALLRDYLASAERHRVEEMEERHRLAREVIRLRADLAAAQEREQRMREAGLLALKVAESWIHDQCDGTDALAPALAELDEARGTLSALGEPQ